MGIRIENLAVAYGGVRVIDGLSLRIEPGSFFTLLGPSGCGKTTLLRTIAGFIPAEAGKLSFGETDVTALPAHLRDIGMVFQDYALFPDKTVFDNVAYGLRARRRPEDEIKKRVEPALERVGLEKFHARRPAELSGGQRQRVALARALVIKPKVLLMDEPLSNLDAKMRIQVRETIIAMQREVGITTVFVTHDQEEALAMSDRIGVMRAGKLEQVGTPGEIYRSPATGYVADFVGGANLIDVDVDTAATGRLAVVLGGEKIAAWAPSSLAKGRAVMIARPEDIALSPSDGAGVVARVVARQFLGSNTSYRLALKDGRSLGVDLHGDKHDAFALNTEVSLRFDPAKTLVLAS